MTISSRTRIMARSVAGVAAVFAVGLLVSGARADAPNAANAPTTPSLRSILLFPIAPASDAGTDADTIAPRIDSQVLLKLDAVNRFKITEFRRHLATVQEAIADKDLTETDVTPPFSSDDETRAAKVAERMAVDGFFVGDLDSYKVDAASKTVTIQVIGTLYAIDYSGTTPQVTSVKTVGASVTEKPQAVSDELDTVTQFAVDDAAAQIASAINSVPSATGSTVVQGSQRGHAIGAGGAVLLAVAAGAILYAVFHHDSSSSSSSGGTSSSGSGNSGGSSPPSAPVGLGRSR